MEFLGVSDLVGRWIYSRQGVHRLVKTEGFPKPLFSVNAGRVHVWNAAEIESYEMEHPELVDHGLKTRKQRGYFRARMKGPRQDAVALSAEQVQP